MFLRHKNIRLNASALIHFIATLKGRNNPVFQWKLSKFPSSIFNMPYTCLWSSVRDLQQTMCGWFPFVSLTLATFDKIKFPVLMHVKPPDDAGLEELIPSVWWATLENVSGLLSVAVNQLILSKKSADDHNLVCFIIDSWQNCSLIIHKSNVKVRNSKISCFNWCTEHLKVQEFGNFC